MKLGARDIAGFLAAPEKQTIGALLYGPDAGLVRERSRALCATLLGKNSDPVNRVELSHDQVKSDPALLRDELSALSLMAGKRVVVLAGAADKLTATIESALEGLNPTAYLVVEADELAGASSLRQFFEKGARLASVACYRDEGRSLEETVRAALSSRHLRASPDALQYLLAQLGNDRGVTVSEIDKIALYMGEEKEVTLDIAMRLVGYNASQSLEDICHAVACGDARGAEAQLAQLLHEGTQPVAVMRALLRHFQRLETAQAHMQAGRTPDEALAQLRPPVFFKYAPPTRRALSRWNARALAQALALFMKTEKELKSGLMSPALLTGHALQQATRMA